MPTVQLLPICSRIDLSHKRDPLLGPENRPLFLYFLRRGLKHVAGLPDHLIRLEEDSWGNREPEGMGGLEVDGPAGAFEQRIAILNNSLYNRCLYHQNGPLGCKWGKKRSF